MPGSTCEPAGKSNPLPKHTHNRHHCIPFDCNPELPVIFGCSNGRLHFSGDQLETCFGCRGSNVETGYRQLCQTRREVHAFDDHVFPSFDLSRLCYHRGTEIAGSCRSSRYNTEPLHLSPHDIVQIRVRLLHSHRCRGFPALVASVCYRRNESKDEITEDLNRTGYTFFLIIIFSISVTMLDLLMLSVGDAGRGLGNATYQEPLKNLFTGLLSFLTIYLVQLLGLKPK